MSWKRTDPAQRFSFPARPSLTASFVDVIESALPRDLQSSAVRLGLVEVLTIAIIHGALEIRVDRSLDLATYLEEITLREHAVGRLRSVNVTVEVRARSATVSIEDGSEFIELRDQSWEARRGLRFVRPLFNTIRSELGGHRIVLEIGAPS
ncbi:MAG: hypothetical protein U0271_46610 [Polyangiaceae bacterium]